MKKNRKRFSLAKEFPEPEIIGIIGTGRGVGTTHFSVMTAGYLSGVLRRRCAVLEWNGHGDFKRMGRLCAKKSADGPWRILGSDYYEKAGIETLLLCKKSGYESVIVDYGAICEGRLKEFLCCGRRFLLGSLSEWQSGPFLELEREIKSRDSDWKTLVVFGSEESRKNMEKTWKAPVGRIPFLADAFSVNGETLDFYQRLL